MFAESGVTCEIAFNNDEGSYESGQVVVAQLSLTFNKPTKCQCIYAKFIGEGEVKWQKRRHGHHHHGHHRHHQQKERSLDFSAHEEYFCAPRDVVRNEDGSEMLMESKRYTFEVSCTLPHNLPSSFQGQFGSVKYFLKLFMDNGAINELTYKEFKVHTPLDLNQLPHLKLPKKLEMTRDFGVWIWRSGPLNVNATVPFTGFVPNQNVTISMLYENGSNSDVSGFKVYVKQIATFHSSSPKRESKTEEIEVCETKLDGVQKNVTKLVQGILTIPDIKPANLTRCSIIEVKYLLKFKGTTSGGNVFNEVPIVIGAIPFANFNYEEANLVHVSQRTPPAEPEEALEACGTVEQPRNEKSEDHPPSYEEVVNTSSNVQIGWNANMNS